MGASADLAGGGSPRILLCGWAGAGNVGDELLTRAMVVQLREAGAIPVVASRNPGATARAHPGVEAIPWGPRGVGHLGEIDAVCVGPGGILQDRSSVWNLGGHLVLPWLLRRRRKPVAAVGVGAEPLVRRSSGLMLRSVLGGAPVVARDAESTGALRAVGLRATTAVDVVFGLALPEQPRRAEIVVAVGPTARPGRVAPASRRLTPPPVEEIAVAVDELASRLECRVVLTRFRGPRDAESAAAIGSLLRADHEVLADDIDVHVDRVVSARLVVSSRYHPIVLAAASGTPVLAVSEQAKVRALMAQLASPLAVHLADWSAVAGADPVPSPGPRAVMTGVESAHEALRQLVHRARG